MQAASRGVRRGRFDRLIATEPSCGFETSRVWLSGSVVHEEKNDVRWCEREEGGEREHFN